MHQSYAEPDAEDEENCARTQSHLQNGSPARIRFWFLRKTG
jgi:hypothetical protein